MGPIRKKLEADAVRVLELLVGDTPAIQIAALYGASSVRAVKAFALAHGVDWPARHNRMNTINISNAPRGVMPRPASDILDENIEEVRIRLGRGETLRDVSREFAVSDYSLRQFALRHGIEWQHKNPWKKGARKPKTKEHKPDWLSRSWTC